MSDLLREIQFHGLRSEIKDSHLVSDIDRKANMVISLVESGQTENGLKIVQFIRKVCWDQLNVGEYSKIDPIWRMVSEHPNPKPKLTIYQPRHITIVQFLNAVV